MKLPKLEKPDRYQGLYVFDFGDHAAVGFTAEEVAELLDSEQYGEGKAYKIHRAFPDGRLELKGIPSERFQLEAGMLFHAEEEATARNDFERLIRLAAPALPPCRAKLHLARRADGRCAVALIYPAEYDEEISSWLLAGGYRTSGSVEGGVGAVERYYRDGYEILDQHQFFGIGQDASRTGQELLQSVGRAVQR